MMKAILIAFSTYSKIPMPHFKWDPKALQYSMCAFPLVGAVIGAGEFAIWYLFGFLLQWSEVFTAALLTIFPILITGGIHMDGFLDTVDAKSSYKSKEEKLQILKDPHTGGVCNYPRLSVFPDLFWMHGRSCACAEQRDTIRDTVWCAGTRNAVDGRVRGRICAGTCFCPDFRYLHFRKQKKRHAGRYRTPCK